MPGSGNKRNRTMSKPLIILMILNTNTARVVWRINFWGNSLHT
ncbi:hypothetical protein TREAZ_3167 [Leadbettera azotonutricia ZAS-9]|uniref:Uncharacterized protein n=1 Tax=Leadbettera azotonutricia (strain ATCC BAA-888 / DSM 13862 / ZAS-9) TaxID=545695 RepID=F5Y9V2_LEAAZ|nr:hypothetical protein TREAZ_3167 [Leadbettera azotonutricia ZAS-9]